ncbi:hypothetical protein [Streptomyces orinoci]|uniref:Uncharacterized protein n=1 Tax=Streptomyces orinoci TaxID=67339 RepID=A0ABV3K769_STRON|nr:hypothetical protein [Streptomyces orinoci]
MAEETARDSPNLPLDKGIFVGSPGVGINHARAPI